MLDAGADPDVDGIGFRLLLGELAPKRPVELGRLSQLAAFQDLQIALRPVGGVGSNRAGGVFGIEQDWKAAAVMLGCIGDGPAADQAVAPADGDMALVSKDGHSDLDGLALRILTTAPTKSGTGRPKPVSQPYQQGHVTT
jgi:hypothetical protein